MVPFRIEFSDNGTLLEASFFNGDEKISSTRGRLDGKSVRLDFDHYASRLDAILEDGERRGIYGNPAKTLYTFEAVPHRATLLPTNAVPEISGLWEIPVESSKGERAWRLIVRQSGAEVTAAILRMDGDTGALTGSWEEGKFVLSHFSGARPSVLELTPQEKGHLQLVLRTTGGAKTYTAIPATEARSQGMPEPSDPALHTRLKDPSQPLVFSFPDLNGRLISSTDTKFHGKVLLINITGSWCPNCHDEAPFLAELYRRYRSLGLEIVGVDFEDTEQLKEPTRLKAFIRKYRIEYTYLIAGEPGELADKIPEVENLNAWPTTFFVGRDGLVRHVHAGFAAAASGEFHLELKREITKLVENLLGESVDASR